MLPLFPFENPDEPAAPVTAVLPGESNPVGFSYRQLSSIDDKESLFRNDMIRLTNIYHLIRAYETYPESYPLQVIALNISRQCEALIEGYTALKQGIYKDVLPWEELSCFHHIINNEPEAWDTQMEEDWKSYIIPLKNAITCILNQQYLRREILQQLKEEEKVLDKRYMSFLDKIDPTPTKKYEYFFIISNPDTIPLYIPPVSSSTHDPFNSLLRRIHEKENKLKYLEETYPFLLHSEDAKKARDDFSDNLHTFKEKVEQAQGAYNAPYKPNFIQSLSSLSSFIPLYKNRITHHLNLILSYIKNLISEEHTTGSEIYDAYAVLLTQLVENENLLQEFCNNDKDHMSCIRGIRSLIEHDSVKKDTQHKTLSQNKEVVGALFKKHQMLLKPLTSKAIEELKTEIIEKYKSRKSKKSADAQEEAKAFYYKSIQEQHLSLQKMLLQYRDPLQEVKDNPSYYIKLLRSLTSLMHLVKSVKDKYGDSTMIPPLKKLLSLITPFRNHLIHNPWAHKPQTVCLTAKNLFYQLKPLMHLFSLREKTVQGTNFSSTPLHNAIEESNFDEVRTLLEKSYPVNVLNAEDETPLMCALYKYIAMQAYYENKDTTELEKLHLCIEKLVQAGALPPYPSRYGSSLLRELLQSLEEREKEGNIRDGESYKALVALLCTHEASSNTMSTVLHQAIQSNNTEKASQLVKEGHPVNCLDSDYRTPLHYAIEQENQALSQLLLQHGASLYIRDKEGRTAFSLLKESTQNNESAQSNNVFYDDLFIWASHKGIQFEDRYTPLHDAAAKGDLQKVRALVEKGYEVNSGDSHGQTPLHRAIDEGNFECALYLLKEAGACMEIVDVHGNTPLELLHYQNPANKSLYEELLAHTLSSLHHDADLFHHMMKINNIHLGKTLLNDKAYIPWLLDKDGYTAFDYLLPDTYWHEDSIRNELVHNCLAYPLIEGAESNIIGETALHVLAEQGAIPEEFDRILAQNPWLFDSIDNSGNTIFHKAILALKKVLFSHLLQKAQEFNINVEKMVNQQNRSGFTPLASLVNSNAGRWKEENENFLHIIKALLEAGADPTISTHTSHHTALALAAYWSHEEALLPILKHPSITSDHIRQAYSMTSNASIKRLLNTAYLQKQVLPTRPLHTPILLQRRFTSRSEDESSNEDESESRTFRYSYTYTTSGSSSADTVITEVESSNSSSFSATAIEDVPE